MKFCSKCGKEIADDSVVCIHCGRLVAENQTASAVAGDAPNMGWAVLGFFIPIVGLILYLTNKNTTPLKAKSAGKGALIGFIVSIIVGIIYGVAVSVAIESALDDYYYY